VGDGLNVFAFLGNSPTNYVDPLGDIKGERGLEKMETQLPDGRIINKKTPLVEVQKASNSAKDLGLSKKQVLDLKGISKVIKRMGGAGILIDIFTDPAVLEGAESLLGSRFASRELVRVLGYDNNRRYQHT
jgi:hypothetical protein